MLWLLACGSPAPGVPVLFSDPILSLPEDARVGPVRIWTAWASRPVAVTLTVEGGGESWEIVSPPAFDHRVQLTGLLAETDYEVTAVGDGRALDPVAFRTEAQPSGPWWPTFDVLAWDPARAEPGWTLIPIGAQGLDGGVVLVLDAELRVRWWFDSPEAHPYDAVPDGADGLWIREGRGMRHLTWDGRMLALYQSQPEEGAIALEAGPVDHELVPDADGGFWSFADRTVTQEVPSGYGSSILIEAEVADNPLVHVAADGSTLAEFPLAPLLDPSRCAYDGLDGVAMGALDFVHANTGIPTEDGGAVVSLRNQDVILRLGPDGEIRWMLGDPAGWSPEWKPLLLKPLGIVSWPYHMHGVHWVPEDQLLYVFDNHAWGAIPPNPPLPGPWISRAVAYRVNEVARTVQLEWVHDQTTTGPLYSPVLGEVQPLPITGNRLVVYGSVRDEGTALGWGERTARLLEVAPGAPGPLVLDLRLRVDAAVAPEGIWVYRAERGLPPFGR